MQHINIQAAAKDDFFGSCSARWGERERERGREREREGERRGQREREGKGEREREGENGTHVRHVA